VTLYRIQTTPEFLEDTLYLGVSGALTDDPQAAADFRNVEDAARTLTASGICRSHPEDLSIMAFNAPKEAKEPEETATDPDTGSKVEPGAEPTEADTGTQDEGAEATGTVEVENTQAPEEPAA
jgi:hypothetical protein